MSKYTYMIETTLKYNYESRLADHIIKHYGFHTLDELMMNVLDRAMSEHDMYCNDTRDAEEETEEFIAKIAKNMIRDYI